MIGDFSPSLLRTSDYEVGYKHFNQGDEEPEHIQLVATEISLITRGLCVLGGKVLRPGDICRINPGEKSSFSALEDCELLVVKFPSMPADKIITEGKND